MMSVITASYTNVSSTFFGAKFQKSIEEILVAPIPPVLVISAYCMGGVLRGMLVGVLIFIVSLIFTDVSITHIGISLYFLVATALLFSLAGMFNGFFAKSFDEINIIPAFVITPMVYLGGVFYSLDFLSPFWQAVSRWNPILYMVNGLRYGFLDIQETPVLISALAIAGFCILLFVINLRLFLK